jgi:hypothetical protein
VSGDAGRWLRVSGDAGRWLRVSGDAGRWLPASGEPLPGGGRFGGRGQRRRREVLQRHSRVSCVGAEVVHLLSTRVAGIEVGFEPRVRLV